RNSPGELDSSLGRRSHVRDDREAPGLVRFAAALLGCSDYCVLLRRLRKAAGGLRGPAQRREMVREGRRRRLVQAFTRGTSSTRHEVLLRFVKLAQRERYSR